MFYKLVDQQPIKCATGQEWAEWYEAAAQSGERVVGRDELDGSVVISTIFTGIDPNPLTTTRPSFSKP